MVAMNIRIKLRRLYFSGLTLLCFFAVNTAVAQRQSTAKQDLNSESFQPGPPDWALPATNLRDASDRWAPPDIAAVQPLVAQDVTCSAPDIMSKAGTRVEEFVRNLDRFSATEVIQHQSVNHSGMLRRPEIQEFNYVFSIRKASDGSMIVKEDRESTRNQGQYIDRIATQGTSSLVLVFHPDYMKNFRMACEGLGKWHGQPAWQIRFDQQPDTHCISGIVMDGRVYDVKLRGRGWILADSYQVAH